MTRRITPIYMAVLDEDVKLAQFWEAEIMRRLRPGGNYTGLEREGRFFLGYIGERLVTRWLKGRHVPAVHRVDTSGRSQKTDIQVGRLSVDVKASANPIADEFKFPLSQKVEDDYYVAVHLIEEVTWGKIWGGMTRQDALNLPTKTYPGLTIPTRFKAYEELPMDPNDIVDVLRLETENQ